MSWRWVKRRRLTIGFIAFFGAWYLLQLSVLSSVGTKAAAWWFYLDGPPSPGYLLAPLSHNMAEFGHLRRNAILLFIGGGLAEPYLAKRRYIALFLGLAGASLVTADVLSLAFHTQWVLAGPSGGVYGLWAYIAVRNRSLVLDADDWKEQIESILTFAGLLMLVAVPVLEKSTTGMINVSHAIGIELGCGIALVEAPSRIQFLS
jgi:membrane associated rhomboid family serine protease